jgi:Rrf2 family protein
MFLTVKSHYAIQALLDINKYSEGNPIKLQDISNRQGIPLPYLEQIFRKLRQRNIVYSVRGPGGGYCLKENINIGNVLQAIGETISLPKTTKIKYTDEHQMAYGILNEAKIMLLDQFNEIVYFKQWS